MTLDEEVAALVADQGEPEPRQRAPLTAEGIAKRSLERQGIEPTDEAVATWMAEKEARAAAARATTQKTVDEANQRTKQSPAAKPEATKAKTSRPDVPSCDGWVIGGEPKRWAKVPDMLHRVLKDAGITRGSTWQIVLWALGAATRVGPSAGRIRSSTTEIEAETGLSRATIKRAKQELATVGLLVNHEQIPGVWHLYLALPEDLCKGSKK